jgi:hypothetical protein
LPDTHETVPLIWYELGALEVEGGGTTVTVETGGLATVFGGVAGTDEDCTDEDGAEEDCAGLVATPVGDGTLTGVDDVADTVEEPAAEPDGAPVRADHGNCCCEYPPPVVATTAPAADFPDVAEPPDTAATETTPIARTPAAPPAMIIVRLRPSMAPFHPARASGPKPGSL